MLKELAHQIYDHPLISGILGSVMAGTFGMINVPETTEVLELIGVIIKDIGILAGATVAIASLFSYASKHWLKKGKINEPTKEDKSK